MSTREHEVRALLAEYQACLKSFIPKRKKTIELLEKIYEALNCHSKNGNIAEITGAGVGILGSLGILAAPFTGGLSLVAAGTALAIGGAATGIGAGVTVHVLEGQLIDEAKKILTDDDEASKRVNELGKKIADIPKEVLKALKITVAASKGVATTVKAGHDMAKFVSLLTGAPLRKGVATAGKVAKIAGTALEVVAIPLNIWQIVDSAQSLSKDSEKATQIREIIEELKEDLEGKEELVC